MASSRDLDILAWTMLGEAGGEGRDGMADVGHVILNRLETGKYGSSISDVALANKQFSAWNKGEGGNDPQGRYPKSSREFQQARQLAEQVVSGAIPGPPGKPLDYHTPDISPYWASSKDRYGTYERNGHLYYPSQPVPPGEIPNVVASRTDTTPPQQITGKSNAPTSAASRQVPTNWFTPRLAPGNEQAYTYQIPDQTPTSVVGGLGSLTPDRAPPPLPRPRPGMPVVPYDRGQTIASVPTPQRQSLPPLPPSNLAPANLVSTTMERANAARVPELQAALARPQSYVERNAPPNLFGMNGDPGTAAPGTRVASIPTSGVGRPPATRSVPSVPVPASPAMGITADRGAMPTRSAFLSEFGLANPRETLAAPLPTTAVPGPNNVAKGNERLLPPPRVQIAGLDAVPSAVPTVGTALDVVPNAGFPPMPRPRPVPFSMPTPMGQRPTLPMPRANPFAMPTPVAQRPNPNALRVTVNGAGSYNAPQRAPTPTREQMLAAIRARSRGPTAFGHGGTIDGAVQPIGTLSGRR